MKRRLHHPLRTGLAVALALGTVTPLAAQEFPRIQLPPGFKIEKVVDGLSFPTSLAWDDRGRMYVAEAGGAFLELDAPARILRVEPGRTTVIANLSGTVIAPLVGLEWHNGAFYITHRATEDRTGAVSRVTMDGQATQLFKGVLDAASEHMLSDIQAGPDGRRIYFTTGPGFVTLAVPI